VSPSKGRSGGLPDERFDSSDSEEEHTKEDNAMEITSAEKVDEDGNPLSDCKSLTFVICTFRYSSEILKNSACCLDPFAPTHAIAHKHHLKMSFYDSATLNVTKRD
jgi:hypothetical protein